MTGNDAHEYNIATIRQLLLAAFTPEELRRFCYDHPSFRPIVDLFGPGLGKADMVDRVVEYCDRHVLLEQLLSEVKQVNPGQYARYIEPEPAKAEPVPSSPELLTIDSPISLLLVRIPAGEFLMGSDSAKDKDARKDELPQHSVHVPDFHIGKYPVTNLQYKAFVQATKQHAPDYWDGEKIPGGEEDHPVVLVSWKDAVAFCAWLSQEAKQPFRLPTEAEWEKAARGTDGRIYPWGNDPPHSQRCHYAGKVQGTSPVGHYSPQGDSAYGCAGMAGNVWEWCHSLYVPYPYYVHDGREKAEIVDDRVMRGGSWQSPPSEMRCAHRRNLHPLRKDITRGFRVAMGPPG